MDMQELIADYKVKMMKIAEDAFNDIVLDRAPYLESDTVMNVEFRTNNVLHSMLSGAFEVRDDGYIQVHQEGFLITTKVTAHEWDGYRRELIKLMPGCPKDKEIELLKSRIKELELAWYDR